MNDKVQLQMLGNDSKSLENVHCKAELAVALKTLNIAIEVIELMYEHCQPPANGKIEEAISKGFANIAAGLSTIRNHGVGK